MNVTNTKHALFVVFREKVSFAQGIRWTWCGMRLDYVRLCGRSVVRKMRFLMLHWSKICTQPRLVLIAEIMWGNGTCSMYVGSVVVIVVVWIRSEENSGSFAIYLPALKRLCNVTSRSVKPCLKTWEPLLLSWTTDGWPCSGVTVIRRPTDAIFFQLFPRL